MAALTPVTVKRRLVVLRGVKVDGDRRAGRVERGRRVTVVPSEKVSVPPVMLSDVLGRS